MVQPQYRVGADATNDHQPECSEHPLAALDRLSPAVGEQHSKFVLGLRLGAPRRTLAEVGEVLGIAPESVSRLEQSALQKVAHFVARLEATP